MNEQKISPQDGRVNEALTEILTEKLETYKTRLIRWAKELGDNDISEWGQRWSSGPLHPMPKLKHIKGFSSFYFALATFVKADLQIRSKAAKKSLDTLFGLEALISHENGLRTAKKRNLKEKAEKRHKETKENKRLAIEFYIQNDLTALSNQKAAEILEKEIPFNVRTLKSYISEYKRYRELIMGSPSEAVAIFHRVGEIVLGLEQKILASPVPLSHELSLLSQARQTQKDIEIRMLNQFLSETYEETMESLDTPLDLGNSPDSINYLKLFEIASDLWSDPDGPLKQGQG
jgi:hypothetical protein